MILKRTSHIPILASRGTPEIPVIAVKTLVLFPGELVTLQLKKPENLALIREYAESRKEVAIAYTPRGDYEHGRADLCQIGTAARIVSAKQGPGDSQVIVLEGLGRIELKAIGHKTPYLMARIAFIDEDHYTAGPSEKLFHEILDIARQIITTSPAYPNELLSDFELGQDNPGQFADRLVSTLHLPTENKQKILEAINVDTRFKRLTRFMKLELQRAIFLSEDAVLPHDSGFGAKGFPDRDNSQLDFIRDLREKVNGNKTLPEEVRERCHLEINRLNYLSTASAEHGTTSQYIKWLMKVPWNVVHQTRFDLEQLEQDIDKEYYGSKSIKKRILERIAVRKLTGDGSDRSILCLAGMAGTGKASLAKAIAKALKKEFVRVSVGGVREASEIKGMPRTYVGAGPGMIIRTLCEAETSDPVILIEDIDYFSEESSTSLSTALLEAIDPRYNYRFLDKYLGVAIDLSRATFICTVKSSEEIPEIFANRFEIIELTGYIEKDKIRIARKYIIPDVLKKHGLLKRDIIFNEKGLQKIIRNYTLEAGLLHLKRKIQMICRHVAKEKAAGVTRVWKVNERTVESLLGTPQYIPETPGKQPEIGVAIGLAWTGQGGDLMLIEGLKMKGSGEVITTGSLGEVMKESITAAHSYVRSKADVLGIDHADFDNFDIHIHFPSGAIPKDGPSAGVAVSLVIASVMSERPIPNNIAMTGEVTLRGKVLQVGGLVEKISAAYRAGIQTVFVPRESKKDLKNLPADILKKTRFVFIETVDEVFAQGLLDFVPSSYTLEKLFADEIKKAKSRKKSHATRSIAAKGRKKK
nr:LON peptidase substrate-binding domain-containing protein [candidate division Zixibacteria bacterium]